MRRWAKYLLVAVVVVVVLVAASFAAAAYTGRSSFCISCHEMQPYDDSWRQSPHHGTDCAECHIPKGRANFVRTKMFNSLLDPVSERGRSSGRGPHQTASSRTLAYMSWSRTRPFL